MPGQTRRADVVWEGNLVDGRGTVNAGSGAIAVQPVSWPARVEDSGGMTSPEELIAAAHASCYAMALSHTLTEAGHPPERLDVSCEVALEAIPDGIRIATSALTVRGRVPGLDAGAFTDYARRAEVACPVSNALRGSLQITVEASLE